MSTKKFAGVGLAIGAATAATAMVIGSTTAYADGGVPESAYGIAAAGLVDVSPVPFVQSDDGELVTAELLGLGEIDSAGVGASVLDVSAQDGFAQSTVASVVLAELLQADVVRTVCDDGVGRLEIVNGSVLGQDISGTDVQEEIDLSPVARIGLGDQIRNDDGSLTVNGITVEILPVDVAADADGVDEATGNPLDGLGDGALDGLLGDGTLGDLLDDLGLTTGGTAQTIIIGSATCDAVDDGKDDGDDPTDPKDDGKDYDDAKDHGDDGKDDGKEYGDDGKDGKEYGASTGDTGSDTGSGPGSDAPADTAPAGGAPSGLIPAAPAPVVIAASLPVTA